MINGLAVPAVQQPTFGVAQRNQQVRPPALDFASALAQDIPVVQAVIVLAAFFFVTVNLIVDLLYSLLDPRLTQVPLASRKATADV